jgi:hypothetical protein
MKVYIAGPMTNVPKFNIPLFDFVATALRNRGWDVVSPAELDSPAMRAAALESRDGDYEQLKAATGETWGDVLARDVKVLSDTGIQAIVLLPGWYNSRGATLETTVGLLNKLKFFQWQSDGTPDPMSNISVMSNLLDGWANRGTYAR